MTPISPGRPRQDRPLRIGMLVGSPSVTGGGVPEAMRTLSLALARLPGISPEIFSLEAEASDMLDFGDIPVHLAHPRGPAAFGYAADLDGMRLRANDRGSKVLAAVGANLINIELAEIYGSMDRGLVDGIYGIPFSFSGPLKYPEVADYFTDLGIGVSTVNALSMSEETWDSLTEEQREVVLEVNAEVPAKIAEVEQTWNESSCDAVKADGDTAFVLPQAESDKIADAGKEEVDQEWRDQVTDAGADPEAFYSDYRAALDAAEADNPGIETGVAICAAG